MKKSSTNSAAISSSISKIFSKASFKNVFESGESYNLDKKISQYSSLLGIQNKNSRLETLEILYEHLLNDYRCEFVYKNLITNKILLGRHNLRTSTLLNEFRIGKSVADLVIINGSSTVYEIKTELDNSERLIEQLRDYRKAFPSTNIVTHNSLIDKYLNIIDNTGVGLIALNSKFQLSVIKKAEHDERYLQVKNMFKSLRKEEYSNILRSHFGYVPEVPNMFFYRDSLELSMTIPVSKYQELMSNELRKRKPDLAARFDNAQIPRYLTNICLATNPTNREYENLFTYLNNQIN